MGANVTTWLQRFAAFDGQEEEVIDQGPEYRALLRDQTHKPAVADASASAQAHERKSRQPA